MKRMISRILVTCLLVCSLVPCTAQAYSFTAGFSPLAQVAATASSGSTSTQSVAATLSEAEEFDTASLSSLEANEDYDATRVLVVFKDDVSVGAAQDVTTEVSSVETLSGEEAATSMNQALPLVSVDVADGATVGEAIEELQEQPEVAYVQPVYLYQLEESVNDPMVSEQWALSANQGVHAFEAWDIAKTNKSVCVAIIDSGVDLNHPDLVNNIVGSYCATQLTTSGQERDEHYGDSTTDPTDVVGHGTHVAGIVAAECNNEIGVAGVTYNANVYPIRAFSRGYKKSDGTWEDSPTASTDTLTAAINYLLSDPDGDGQTIAVENNVKVINLSLNTSGDDKAFHTVITKARSQGILTIAAAGNNGSTATTYPADYDDVLSVINLQKSGEGVKRYSGSNYGSNKNVSAPGTTIYSTYYTVSTKTSTYGSSTGTSMASPLVAGVAALCWAYDPGLSVDEVQKVLEQTATDLGVEGFDEEYAWGEVNAYAALQYLAEERKDISGAEISAIASQTFTGEDIEPDFTVTLNDETLTRGQDYSVTYSNNINVGTAKVTITGRGEYKGEKSTTFEIEKAKVEVPSADTTTFVYNGSVQTYQVKESSLYSVTNNKQTDAGTYSVSVTLNDSNNYEWKSAFEGSFSFVINKAKVTVPSAKTGLVYNGKEQTGVELPAGAQYTLSGNTATNAGSHTATAKLTDTKNYEWDVATPTTDDQQITWSIGKGQGSASFEKSSMTKSPYASSFTNALTNVSQGDVTYSSSAPSVATVNETTGEVTINAKGKTTITANVAETNNYTACTASYTLNVADASVSYTTHVQNIGWQDYVSDGKMAGTSGMAYRLEGIKIKLSNIDGLSGGISYRTHVQNIGWQSYVSDGAMSGTSGMSYRLEAIQIKLTGDVADAYDVYYRVHAQNIGWMGWAKNGEQAGTAGYAYRLEAIQIVLVEKGGAAPGNVGGIKSAVAYAFDSETDGPSDPYRDELVSYNTHVQNIGWQNWSKLGKTAGTSGLAYRLEGMHIKLGGDAAKLNGSIKYRTHVQNIGWQSYVSDGDMSGTSGMSYRLEAIQIKLTDEVLANYDVYYRVHAQNIGWMGWAKNDEQAGTAGYAYRLEAIQIVLVKKGGDAPSKNYGGITSVTDKAFMEK